MAGLLNNGVWVEPGSDKPAAPGTAFGVAGTAHVCHGDLGAVAAGL